MRLIGGRPLAIGSLSWLRHLSSFLVFVLQLALVALVLELVGCDGPIAPPLVEVTELAPREVEPGDRLEVHGTGFPQGHTGRVTLRGAIHRAGEGTRHPLGIEVDGTVVTPDRLEIVVRDSLSERFCGRGDRAAHATFRGDVEVSFASNTPGAPPLVGLLRGATLDVIPSTVRATVAESRAIEGGRVLSFLGIVPGPATTRGLPVEQLSAGSPAERVGIQVGDVVVAVDGLHTLSVADVLPVSSRTVELTIRHGDSSVDEVKTLSLLGYAGDRFPTDYASALVIVGLALAVLFVLLLPGPRSLATLELRIASRLRQTTARSLATALFGRGRHTVVSILVTTVVATFVLTPYLITPEVDGVALLAAGASMLVWSRVAAATGALRSLDALARGAMIALTLAAALAITVAQTGAIELAEIVRVQGGAPWEFNAARHPACAILALVYLAAVVALLRARLPVRPAPPPPQVVRLASHAGLLERAGLLLASALAVLVFFGGWQLPGTAEGWAPPTRGLLLLGMVGFLVKTWAVTGACFGASRVAATLSLAELQRFVVRRLVPGLLVGGALVAVSRRVVPGTVVESAFGAIVVAGGLLFVLRLTTRIRAAVARPEPHASPFL